MSRMRRSQFSLLPISVTGTRSDRETPRSGPLRTISSPARGSDDGVERSIIQNARPVVPVIIEMTDLRTWQICVESGICPENNARWKRLDINRNASSPLTCQLFIQQQLS